MKILGTATYLAEPTPAQVTALGGDQIRNDGAVIVEVNSTDWNCPKYITQRFTAGQVAAGSLH